MNQLNSFLNKLWASVLDSFSIDVLTHTIILNANVIDDDKCVTYKVIFKGVSAFYFLEDYGEKRLNPPEPDNGDYTEITSIDYYPNGIGTISIKSSSESWVNQYFSSANFTLELWNSMLLIEARSITINDYEFEVGYPTLQ
ncbi:hypothetical protein AM501_09705 [Aneurinibacillus migulanus]|uniref:YxiG family protein n=1 Tax=Aneurinibacillus migulanus TaxID=47500 RepID=UPI0005B85A70|nr:hypothetical protein [Aneurinibacillus migulanus]KIV56421.1 hypothetical protein TS64_09120 [Aneurinibacillus migulanus]KPD08429.1 hypothetical protein AM501_09705 [Aneurinibacillus migulanus]